MAINNLTVLQDLPKFTGDPKDGEPHFVPDIDARTFMRAVENHFLHHNITADDKKIQLMYSLIDKKKGDAVQFLSCYVGEPVTFNEVKIEFLNMYPSFTVTEFRHAAQALLHTNFKTKKAFCAMTALQNNTRAVVEAYLRNEALTEGEFGEGTIIPGSIPLPSTPSSTSTSSTSVPPAHSAQAASTTTMKKVMQNLLMHLFIASETENKVYNKLANIGPKNSSTKFMSETVKAIEKQKLLNNTKKTVANNHEVIWQAARVTPHPPQRQTAAVAGAPRPPTAQGPIDNNRPPLKCHNCNQTGHIKRDCKTCSYCTKYGHTAKLCRARIAQAKGKYCSTCKLQDSHNTVECFKTARNQSNANPRPKVHMAYTDEHVNVVDDTNQNNDETNWAPNYTEENVDTEQY